MKMLTTTWLLFGRGLNTTLRGPAWVIMGLFQPVCYIVLFAPFLTSMTAIPGFPAGETMNVFVPGMLVMLGLLSAAFAGFGVIADLRSGVIERIRVTPANPIAILLGNALRDVVVLVIQAILLILIGLAFGLRVHFVGVVLALVLLTLLGLIMAACSYTLAIVLRDENAVASMIQFLMLPLMLLSGVMIPLALAPSWLQTVAAFTPFSHIVDAQRALFIGDLTDSSVWRGFAISAVLLILTFIWATRSFRKVAS